jgi:hypothetical protein
MRSYLALKIVASVFAIIACIGCRGAKNWASADSFSMSRSSATPDWGKAEPSDPELATYVAADERLADSEIQSNSPRNAFAGTGRLSTPASTGCTKGCCN